jgi:hypothetical protein
MPRVTGCASWRIIRCRSFKFLQFLKYPFKNVAMKPIWRNIHAHFEPFLETSAKLVIPAKAGI